MVREFVSVVVFPRDAEHCVRDFVACNLVNKALHSTVAVTVEKLG